MRDLPAKDGSVDPAAGFAIAYATRRGAARTLRAIATALEDADSLVLATDPDREGEAIAWQVLSWLEENGALGDTPVHRVVFHEVTREAVRAAMARPRDLDMDLVRAQQARRALDYLVGFHLSPVLWRKVRGGRSAKTKPLRRTVPASMEADEITPELARALLALPRIVGVHPETGKTIRAGIGRYGAWLKHGATYVPLPDDEDVLAVGLNRAVALVDARIG